MKNDGLVTFAKTDPSIGMAGIFRPVTRGRRPTGLEIHSLYGGVDLTFAIHTCLDSVDQTFYLVLAAMAGRKIKHVHAHSKGEQGRSLWDRINVKGDIDRPIAVVDTTFHEVMLAAGLSISGRGYETLKSSLRRLARVTIEVRDGDEEYTQNLLSYKINNANGRLLVALNSRMCAAFSGHFARVALDERRALSSDIAKVTHAYLCAWLSAGETRKIGLDRLATKVWGVDPVRGSAQRMRRKRLREQLPSMIDLGWRIDVEGEILTITRPTIIEATEDPPKVASKFDLVTC